MDYKSVYKINVQRNDKDDGVQYNEQIDIDILGVKADNSTKSGQEPQLYETSDRIQNGYLWSSMLKQR